MTDPVEESLGIQAYLKEIDGFDAIIKGRFSDFLVHEGKLYLNICVITTVHSPILLIRYLL